MYKFLLIVMTVTVILPDIVKFFRMFIFCEINVKHIGESFHDMMTSG